MKINAPLVNDLSRESDDSESIDTNATAPNNPGPGRNVGLVLDSVGKRIEHALNRTAGRLRLGPVAVAWEIRNVRRYYREGVNVGQGTNTSEAPTYDELRRAQIQRNQELMQSLGLVDAAKAVNKSGKKRGGRKAKSPTLAQDNGTLPYVLVPQYL